MRGANNEHIGRVIDSLDKTSALVKTVRSVT